MTCPSPADFNTCDPKCRCPSGPCAGIAFNCKSPCPEGVIWDPSRCSCLSGGGTYKIQTDTSGQYNAAVNGTRCFLTYFPEPYFNSLGQFVERRWFFSRQQWPNDGAFTLISPDGPMEGMPLSPDGPPGPYLPLPSDGVSVSQTVLSQDFCDQGPNGAGHTNGFVSWRNVVDNSYMPSGAPVPGGVNYAGCDSGGSSIVSTTITFLGPGVPEDYYESNEITGSGSFKGIVDAETGQPSCQGPSKSS